MKTPSPENRERARGFGSPKRGSLNDTIYSRAGAMLAGLSFVIAFNYNFLAGEAFGYTKDPRL
jgi:hypothetical protein